MKKPPFVKPKKIGSSTKSCIISFSGISATVRAFIFQKSLLKSRGQTSYNMKFDTLSNEIVDDIFSYSIHKF